MSTQWTGQVALWWHSVASVHLWKCLHTPPVKLLTKKGSYAPTEGHMQVLPGEINNVEGPATGIVLKVDIHLPQSSPGTWVEL